MIGHDDEGVKFDAIFVALLLKDFDQRRAFCSTWKSRRREAVALVTK